ncbi:MAG TPA: patatin-like phospholipase family protein [Burkholderiales bacterium]|nr:patatin-like phospholipase family protein [Burkholderiales bacterium]
MNRGTHDEVVLVLQGGGALGSYQAGVFEALAAEGIAPNWVAGTSIGAINAALIAGNAPAERVARLREFWELVSSAIPEPVWAPNGHLHRWLNRLAAAQALVFGVPGFFTPRVPPAPLQPRGTLAAISYYDTTLLKDTLERLVDFERLNAATLRISIGAVNVRTGNLIYFDSAKQRLDVRHIMASGALPPGFAPVEIDGEHYWDGGLASNTPLNYVLEQPGAVHRTVFQVDLFPARGHLPKTMERVAEREKDIRYSSRTRLNTDVDVARRRATAAAMRLLAKLPPELRDDPDARQVTELLRANCVSLDIVQLIYRAKRYENHAKDYEFSRLTMREHWASGRADVLQTLHDARWITRAPAELYGVRVFDLVEPARTAAVAAATDMSTKGLAHEAG